MFNKRNIPDLYRKMNELAYINPLSKQFVWMYDMEWMDYKEVMNYNYEEGESQEILPFAFTGGGDKWVFVENNHRNRVQGVLFYSAPYESTIQTIFQEADVSECHNNGRNLPELPNIYEA